MIKAAAMDQEPKPLIVGERVNSQGSRKIKQLLLADDYEGMVAVGRGQAEGGAHVLDVCVALTERPDEKGQMTAVIKKLALGVDTPVMIDSTEADVVEAALKIYPGRALINSINLEGDGSRVKKVCPLAKKYGSAVVAMTIDDLYYDKSKPQEKGMAKTAARKLEVAKKITEICVNEYGIPAEDIVFDALTFTLATGEDQEGNSRRAHHLRALQRVLRAIQASPRGSQLRVSLPLRAGGNGYGHLEPGGYQTLYVYR
jgi:5-methyltetrahydrofolate--homocysteine methyltransferase